MKNRPAWTYGSEEYYHSDSSSNLSQPPVPLTPTYISPRSAPLPPVQQPATRLQIKGFSTVFRSSKSTKLSSERSSLRSAHSAESPVSSAHSTSIRSYPMHPAPLPVVSGRATPDTEEECPVCLEPLSFSFRLPGEKPHVVPECGHALHEACFTAVYGPVPGQGRTAPRKANLGVCGVCRRPMKVGDGDGGGKSNKLASLTGMGDRNTGTLYPGRDTPATLSRNRAPSAPKPYDPNEDDPLDHNGSVKSGGGQDHSHYVVAPSIQVRSEYPTLSRTTDPSQPLTCIVAIELPGKRAPGAVPGPIVDAYNTHTRPHPDPPIPAHSRAPPPQQHSHSSHTPTPDHPQRRSGHRSPAVEDYTSRAETPANDPFSAITEDLRNRIIDWKGHPLSDLGPLQMFDLLSVRREQLVREFFVYLFKEAIICVVEEKKRSLGRLLSGASSFTDSGSVNSASHGQSKGVLRLRGRIYVRHIKNITASSAAGEMSLTIDMEDELASFILIFKERASLESWKNNIQNLVNQYQRQHGKISHSASGSSGTPLDMEEFGGNSKAARMLSGGSGQTHTTVSTTDSLLNGSSRSTVTSSSSYGSNMSRMQQPSHHSKLATLGEDDEMGHYDAPTNLVTPYTSSGPSNSLTPLPHPPMDLIMIISLPPPGSVPSTAQLKIRVIKTTLDFVLASMSSKDRLSIVTFEVGMGGRVRKTPFLSPSKAQSKARLNKFIDECGQRLDDAQDEFSVRAAKDEKTDVVTAVNHGLDVVLQRKARNPISGMILVSDSSESTRRAQMDLVLARAEAGNVPIHSFGYGRSHDPASLWLMSNHTGGTYTFIKDWYDLRDCVAGCIGGMMSIGLLNMKLHMKIVDGQRFRIRKVSGGPSHILASDGQNVDVDLGELRYGECKEMLIELELDNSDMRKHSGRSAEGRSLNATDHFVAAMGLDSLSIEDSADFADGMMDRMIDEVPVLEVDGSFYDPAASKNVSRLVHPVLLTVTLLPLSSSPPKLPTTVSDPVIARRRMELLASDMITRALVLVSRKNYPQAQKILGETKKILHTVLQTISRPLAAPNSAGSIVRSRKESLILAAVRALQSILQDLQILIEALEENVDLFAHDHRNYGAQQAMILRDQKAWSGRSATERLFWTTDNSIELVARSTDWVARD